MERPIDYRQHRLWFVGLIAALMPVLSWRSADVAKHINLAFHYPYAGDLGWTVYMAGRLGLFAALVWLILSLKSANAPESTLAESPAVERRRIPSFDPLLGLRALAAFMVLMGHYFLIEYSFDVPPHTLMSVFRTLLNSCPWAGVWVFFTLSGYLMCKGFATDRYQFSPDSVFAFYRNRALRIVPLYAGAVFFIGMLTTPGLFHPVHWWQLVALLTFDCSGGVQLNPDGPLWSVSTEVQFYFLAPFLFVTLRAVCRKARNLFPLLLVVGLCAGSGFRAWIGRKYGLGYGFYGYSPLVANLDVFLAGMGIALVGPEKNVSADLRRRSRFIFPVLALVLYSVTAFLTDRYYMPGVLQTRLTLFTWLPALTCVLTALYIQLAQSVGRLPEGTGLLARVYRGITRIGILTYALYVLHVPIFYQFRDTLAPSRGAPVSVRTALSWFPLLLGLVWLAAEAAYRFVEEPFERRKHLPEAALANAP